MPGGTTVSCATKNRESLSNTFSLLDLLRRWRVGWRRLFDCLPRGGLPPRLTRRGRRRRCLLLSLASLACLQLGRRGCRRRSPRGGQHARELWQRAAARELRKAGGTSHLEDGSFEQRLVMQQAYLECTADERGAVGRVRLLEETAHDLLDVPQPHSELRNWTGRRAAVSAIDEAARRRRGGTEKASGTQRVAARGGEVSQSEVISGSQVGRQWQPAALGAVAPQECTRGHRSVHVATGVSFCPLPRSPAQQSPC